MAFLLAGLWSVAGVAFGDDDDDYVPEALLSVDRAVHKAADGLSPVTLTLRNNTSSPMYHRSWPFKVQREDASPGAVPLNSVDVPDVIPQSSESEAAQILNPGKSKFWTWNKKGPDGQFLAAGSYLFIANLYGSPSAQTGYVSNYLIIALTPTGTLAGNHPYPMSMGSLWKFTRENYEAWGESWVKASAGGYHTFAHPAQLSGMWHATLTGEAQPVLRVKPVDSGVLSDLFRFNRPVGHSYAVSGIPALDGCTLTVGSVTDSVSTFVGTWKNCMRLDVTSAATAPKYQSFWFAAGVGLVKFVKDGKVWLISQARIQDTDGTWYLVESDF
jgi:hypothetical protein